jgi:hypothetical protein
MKTLPRLVVITFAVLLSARPALGQQPPGFSFPDFSDTTGLQLVGVAAPFGNALRLTPSVPFQVGGVAPVAKQPVADGFETRFQFQVTAPAGNVDCQGLVGGDGLAFVIQGSDDFALGETGGGLGYGGVANSLAVELDTYCNVELNDPNGNHISVQSLGLQPNSADQSASLGSTGTTLATNLSDGAVHTVGITYVPGTLKVFVDNLVTPVLQVPVNLEAVLSLTQGQAWVGLTAATGDATEIHDIFNWVFTPTGAVLPTTTLVAAILPSSRSVQVGATATAFATLINSGTNAAAACAFSPAPSLPANFTFQTTDSTTNQLTGTPNTPAAIPAGAAQSFVLALTPTGAFAPTDVTFNFACTNTDPVAPIVGVNTLLFSASATPVPDIIAMAATVTNDGIVVVPGTTGTGAFSVATANVGAAAPITASADTGNASVPVAIMICQTNPATGLCNSPPSSSVTTTMAAGATATFGIFVSGSGVAIPFDPAVNRIFVRFKDAGGITRGATSVAVHTP